MQAAIEVRRLVDVTVITAVDQHTGMRFGTYLLLWKNWTIERYPSVDTDNALAQRSHSLETHKVGPLAMQLLLSIVDNTIEKNKISPHLRQCP